MAGSPLLPRSARTGIGWPAIPSYRDAAALALLDQLEASEWWPAERLLAHQLRQLELVLGHARDTVPFYRDRLRAFAGLKPGGLTLEAWRGIPVLLRKEVQTAGEALVSRRIPKDHLPVHEHSTTGSTGRPVVIQSTPITGLFFIAVHLRYHRWHRRDVGATLAKIATLKPEEEALARAGKAVPWVPVSNSGRMFLLDIRTPIGKQLPWVVEKRPDYLLTRPSNLRELLRRSA